jgi:hypothetical protein
MHRIYTVTKGSYKVKALLVYLESDVGSTKNETSLFAIGFHYSLRSGKTVTYAMPQCLIKHTMCPHGVAPLPLTLLHI